jgi:hypothetical protein
MAMGGEETIITGTGVSLSLLDLSADVPLGFAKSFVRVGQFKVPYGRERLTYSGYSQFLDRSVQDLGAKLGRDVGAALVVRPGPFTLIGGVFTGGGRDAPQRFLPQNLGIPMMVVRAGVSNFEENPFELSSQGRRVNDAEFGLFVNGMFTRDTTLGHSSALNVKFADKSLVINPNWNPYLAKSPLDQGKYWSVGADAVARIPVGATTVSAEAEFNWTGFDNSYGAVHSAGGRVQTGLAYKDVELGLRYSALWIDPGMVNGTTSLAGQDRGLLHEITPAATWYVRGDRLKLVADLPILLNTMVITEKGVGTYLAVEQADQVTYVGTGKGEIGRQNVVEARLMLQATF